MLVFLFLQSTTRRILIHLIKGRMLNSIAYAFYLYFAQMCLFKRCLCSTKDKWNENIYQHQQMDAISEICTSTFWKKNK